MTVVSILGIATMLAVGGWAAVGARGATQNAASDFHSALLGAKQRAAERGSDVWVVVYPFIDRKGNEDPANAGAYFVVEDVDLTFKTFFQDDFQPPGNVRPASPNILVESVYLEDYPRRNTRFLPAPIPGAHPAPFASLAASSCSFCGGSKTRGAVVFSGESTARFVRDDGSLEPVRSASLALSTVETPLHNYLFVVTGPTGFVGLY